MGAAGVALMVISASDNLQGYTAALSYAFVVCGSLAGVSAAARRAPVASRLEPKAPGAVQVQDVVSAQSLEEVPVPPPGQHVPQGVVERARSRLRLMFGRRRR